ncbi:MAG: hypothetical protein AB1505_14115 [Candidatus Latescibacterota bacterium]
MSSLLVLRHATAVVPWSARSAGEKYARSAGAMVAAAAAAAVPDPVEGST